jgi:ABC-type sulfate transport system permease subunit
LLHRFGSDLNQPLPLQQVTLPDFRFRLAFGGIIVHQNMVVGIFGQIIVIREVNIA